MTDMVEGAESPGYDEVSDQVRIKLSWRLEGMLKLIDEVLQDDPSALTAGMITAYTGVARTYGGLWRSFDRPVDTGGMIPAAVVSRMLEEARNEAALEAAESERARIEQQSRAMLESANSDVRRRLAEVRTKAESRALESGTAAS